MLPSLERAHPECMANLGSGLALQYVDAGFLVFITLLVRPLQSRDARGLYVVLNWFASRGAAR